jgi:hypothetical protein
LIEAEEDYDFIYEVVNNTSGKVIIANYIRSRNNSTKKDKYLAQTKDIVLEKGKTYQFKYSTAKLLEDFPEEDNSTYNSIGCFFTPEDKWTCSGWENSLDKKNKIHRVTLTDDENSCVNGENKWLDNDPNAIIFTPLATDKGIEITLKNIPEDTNYIQIHDGKQYIYDIGKGNYPMPEEITLTDFYVEADKEYTYYIQYSTHDDFVELEPIVVKATGGKGSLSFTVKTEKQGVVITPDKSVLDLGIDTLRVFKDFSVISPYIQKDSQDYSVTDYFVTSGKKYLYSLGVWKHNYIEIDGQREAYTSYLPRLEEKTVEIPENCGSGELELSTFPKASWDNENQKVVITQQPVVSKNYPEDTSLCEVGFIYRRKNYSSNYYLRFPLADPVTELKWPGNGFSGSNYMSGENSWQGGKTYYPSDKDDRGDNGYIIIVKVGNTEYQIHKNQDKVFDGLPQEITLK